MKVVVDINHPAHVHFFKNFIWEMEERGHKVVITASQKDLAYNLLQKYGFTYIPLGCYGDTLLRKAVNLPLLDLKMYNILRKMNPDILVGIGSIRAAHASLLLKKPCISFEDTEHATEQIRLYLPFAASVCTPSCYYDDIGPKQIHYNGYHELAYLHPNYFTPDPAVLTEIGLAEGDNIFLVRFAAFNASHDTRTEHFDKRYIPELISRLEDKGTVIISSEIKLEPYLQKYQYKLSPDKYHDLLYFSKMYIGEGSTSAMEAAILGVPSLHFERLNIGGEISTILPYIGVLNELQTKYNLLCSFCDEGKLLSKVDEILIDLNKAKAIWGQRRDILLNDKIDVTAFMIWFIENYPDSFDQSKNDPSIRENFKSHPNEVT